MGRINRRDVLAAGTLAGAPLLGAAGGKPVTLVLDPLDPLAASAPVRLAASGLQAELSRAGYAVVRATRPGRGLTMRGLKILATGPSSNERRVPESFALRRVGDTIMAVGADARGVSYALWELKRRVRAEPKAAFDLHEALGDAPINPVRSVMRQFTSEAYDKAWFYDRDMWPVYLARLAESRFNRLDLTFGLAYDQLGKVRDSYFLFTYPFLLDVPGYGVRVSGLGDAERAHNLDTLRFISEQCVAHGLDFQLGLWMHGYDWPSAPGVAMIEGLTPVNHAAYCRDAMTLLLKTLPAVSSVGLRIHGESGVKEGSYGFWTEIFTGVAASGRPVEIDLHAKGVDQAMIDNALASGMPVNVSPKYWGEHLGLPYHQASIRDYERPAEGQVGKGLMTLSEGARSFTRYGYADLLRDDRKYTVRHRVFPGTQHILAATLAPAHGAQFAFCNSTGADVMEPLTYRGRRGSATQTPRDGYVVRSMADDWDWRKYDRWYESVGRALYNPKTAPVAADALGAALAQAGRILPLVTTAYAPSAACDAYTPELYWNQPLAAEPSPNPYGDTAAPKIFDNAQGFDPRLFSTMREYAAELLGEGGARISPTQVASWLDQLADAVEADLGRAGKARSIDEARLSVDARMQAALGRFFAAKFRAGVLFALGDRSALEACIAQYEAARGHWQSIVTPADGVYGDLSCSDMLSEHGAWADKLPLIDADIAAVKAMLDNAGGAKDPKIAAAVQRVLAPQAWRAAGIGHIAPAGFGGGEAVDLAFNAAAEVTAVTLWYRHVNQAEHWQSAAAKPDGRDWHAAIPAAYTSSPYPLQYYAEVWREAGDGRLYPGFDGWPDPQPYIVLPRRA